MSELPTDVAEWLDAADHGRKRREVGLQIQALEYVELPELKLWDYGEPYTDDAGRERMTQGFKKHQTTGVTWLYTVGSGILADVTGAGKTIQVAGLFALMKERGELTERAIVVCGMTAAIPQWRDELYRFVPSLNVATISSSLGNKRKRIEQYVQNWDVMIIGQQMLLQDLEIVLSLGPKLVVADDVDAIRNSDNKTNHAFDLLTRQADRSIMVSATPVQTKLHELYEYLALVGGRDVFGSKPAFERRYVNRQPITIFDMTTGKKKTSQKVIGYKNMAEFREFVNPFYLRRTHRDFDEDDYPALAPPNNIWIEPYPLQRQAYIELQKGVLELKRENSDELNRKRVAVLSKFNYGQQICAGMHNLGHPDTPGQTSAKMDYLFDNLLLSDLVDEKVVVFAINIETVKTIRARCKAAGIGVVSISGEEPDPDVRRAAVKAWSEKRNIRVIVGTAAMEKSLNLQASANIVCFDMLMNPRRMEQLVGRIRRFGSQHSTVFVHNLLAQDTQEERYLPILSTKAAIGDYVFGEANELYAELSTAEMLAIIAP